MITLIIGWVTGRVLGKGLSKIIGKAGIDDALGKTATGRVLKRSGVTFVRFIDLAIRWLFYLIAISAAVDILEIETLSTLISHIVQYLPSFIVGVSILFVGFVLVDFIGDAFWAVGREMRIEFIGLITMILKLVMYLIVLVIALTMIGIDVSIIYTFVNALALGTAIGICVGLGIAFGWGLKDVIAKNAEKWTGSIQDIAKKMEDTWSPYTRKEKGDH